MTFDEPLGSFNICIVCGWEDDDVQLRFPRMRGANRLSLMQHQQAWLKSVQNLKQPRPELRDPMWRPVRESELRPVEPTPGTGVTPSNDFKEAVGDYYWRTKGG